MKRALAAALRWVRSEPAVVTAISTATATIWTAAASHDLTAGIALGAVELVGGAIVRALVTPTIKEASDGQGH